MGSGSLGREYVEHEEWRGGPRDGIARKRKRGGGGGRDVRICLEDSREGEDMDEGIVDHTRLLAE